MSGSVSPPRFASVAVAVPVRRLFTYRVPEAHEGEIVPGTRVLVPFGPRQLYGTVVECPVGGPERDVAVKPIGSVLPGGHRLPASLLELTRFVADYYLCSWGEAIETALPPQAKPRRGPTHVRRASGAEVEHVPARRRAQRELLRQLPADGTPVPWLRLADAQRRAARGLAADGLVQLLQRPAEAEPTAAAAVDAAEAGPQPTANQAAVLSRLLPAVEGGGFQTFVLYGATGSGKTEVYLRAAERALATGRGVLYLVPEIGLTPLLQQKIARRFPGQVAVLHSGLSPTERRAAWERVLQGRQRFALGTRSAVFAPVCNPGLIVVDEEQDSSYKQDETPRYNARDLAVVRARAEGASLVLGSATPSMESFHHAMSGRYELLRLGGRVQQRPLPEVTLVDMRLEYQQSGRISPLSGELIERLGRVVERGEQAIVLRNRRGWASSLLCPQCGRRVECRRCSISMTWHRAERRLRCHYCNGAEPYPSACPTCGADELRLLGEGSEQIEDLVQEALPGVSVARMDRDTIRRRGAHEALLRRFDRGEIQVLTGTQMIAKGHDFPRVTLVGVLSADQALGLPDFRAAERVFQLLTQVSGRAGRGERPGTVVIQAFDPEHRLLREAARQDFEAFYEREIRYRKALRYPPLTGLVQLLVQDGEALRAREWADELGRALEAEGEGKIMISGPGPAPLERLKGRYRQQLLVRTAGRRRLIRVVEAALERVGNAVPRRALTVDVDPYSLL